MSARSKQELEDLRAWCLGIIDAMAERLGIDLSSMREAIVRSNHLRGMRAATRDMEETARQAPRADWEAIDLALRARFGRGLREADRATRRAIARILKRGRIESWDEYRLLHDYVSERGAEPEYQSEVERINPLLSRCSREPVEPRRLRSQGW